MKTFVCSAQCGLAQAPEHDKIIVHGAREHNLKNICFEIPKGKLVALTGPSGSGKSSIATGILQNECIRQYLESLGMTTDHISKAKVDQIMGLSPSIGVSQRVTDFNSRSTVGTKTGILTILRNLFAALGEQPCSGCGGSIRQPLQEKGKLTTVEKKTYFDCPQCGHPLEKLKMAHFSFNAASGACETCKGVGEQVQVDLAQVLDETKSIRTGGVVCWDPGSAEYYAGVIEAASKFYHFPIDTQAPIHNYSAKQRNFLLYGVQAFPTVKEPKKVSEGKFEGIIPSLLNRYRKSPTASKYILKEPCQACHKARLGKLGREVTVQGQTISAVAEMNLKTLLGWIERVEKEVSPEQFQVLSALSTTLKERILNLIEVGLDYLTLDRTLPTLSAGEAQRVRLAGLLGSGLTGVLYVLDEPTTGLHPHDTAKLVQTLRRIQAGGNTVLIIEHDLEVIEQVDHVLDIGPGGGKQGGEIVASGTPQEVMHSPQSITGRYLKQLGSTAFNFPQSQKGKKLTVRGATAHNLKNIDVVIPVNQLVALTGVSGSGKSTFLFHILDKLVRCYFNQASEEPGSYSCVDGLEHFNRIVTVDQITLRNSSSTRSNVATYTKLFDGIRELFASLPQAKIKGFTAEQFSFNTSQERCENCNGTGVVGVDMAFMADVEMVCPTCNGMRFSEELLEVKFQGHSIADVLDLTVSEAISLFSQHQTLAHLLDLMQQVGLGYLTLGQSTGSLSGGEAQRIKLATELVKSGKESTLYLLDEPTTGLHAQEVEMLLNILRRLVSKGNTVVLIEHNLEAICQADTIIDFGPGGGDAGGEIVASGTPEEVAANSASLTGQSLRAYLNSSLDYGCLLNNR